MSEPRQNLAERERDRGVAAVLRNADDRPVYLENLYRGRSAILVCSGQSAERAMHDLAMEGDSILKMAVNNAPVLNPQLWVCMDPPKHFNRRRWLNPTVLKFVPFTYTAWSIDDKNARPFVNDCPGVVFFWRGWGETASEFFRPRNVWCGQAPVPNAPGVRSVMLPALRILYELGVRRVYLVGADMEARPEHDPEYFDKLRALLVQAAPELAGHGMEVFRCSETRGNDFLFPRATLRQAIDACRRQLEVWP